ncbi:DUF1775 domain-containing protein [Massilia sp. Root418]|uniref:DUF1775 domain-containing protein n=1 Tax=Massilia sp. Root418 TaxID=1736532 RepID=UPI0035A33CFE
MAMRASLTVGAMLSTTALLPSALVVTLPASSVTVKLTLRVPLSTAPAVTVKVAVQVPEDALAVTAEPPPNWLKSTVALAMSLLLSPPAVLFQVAVTVSPILNAPAVPEPPLMLRLASLTTAAWLSTLRPVVSALVAVPPPLVALTETFLPVWSMLPAVMV